MTLRYCSYTIFGAFAGLVLAAAIGFALSEFVDAPIIRTQ